MIAARGSGGYDPGGLGPRASTGTSPPSAVRLSGGHGPNQLSRPPSSVTTDPESAAPSGEQQSATSHACSDSRPNRCSGTVRAAARQTGSGYLRSDAVSKCPAATAITEIPWPAHSSASA